MIGEIALSYKGKMGRRTTWMLIDVKLARCNMQDKTYIVRFKPPEKSIQTVVAAVAEVADDYLWMFKDGELVGLFAMEVVESWAEVISEN